MIMFFRFADKQIRLLRLKAARAQLEEKCIKALEKHKKKDKLVSFYSLSFESLLDFREIPGFLFPSKAQVQ